SRVYLYQISRRRTALGKPFVWWIRETLDVDRMRTGAAVFVGMKNFESFTADDEPDRSTLVLVDRVELVEAGALLLVRVQGSHFLWKMVRRMVGVLAAIGRRELEPADAARLLVEPPDASRSPAALTAPAAGLFLEAVLYKGDSAPGPLRPVLR